MHNSLSRRSMMAGIGIGVLATTPVDAATLDVSSTKARNAMSEAGIRDLFSRYIAALNAHQMDRMDEFVHERVLQNLKPVSRDTVIADLKGHIASVPDFQWRVKDVIVEGDTLAARLFNIGTPARKWLDVEPTGRTVETLEFAFHKARAGKFYEMNYAMDVIGLRRQLGLG